MNILLRLPVLSLVVLLASCATLDKNECLNADWELIGYEDGAKGYQATRIGDHRKACSQHGVSPDLAAYTKGRERGLKTYCTPANGFKVGQQGSSLRQVCPQNMRAGFSEAFDYGRKIYLHREDISRFKNDVRLASKNIHALQEELALNEALIIKGARGPRERAELVQRNRELDRLIAIEEDNISRAGYEIEQLDSRVAELVDHSPYK